MIDPIAAMVGRGEFIKTCGRDLSTMDAPTEVVVCALTSVVLFVSFVVNSLTTHAIFEAADGRPEHVTNYRLHKVWDRCVLRIEKSLRRLSDP